MIIAKYLSRLCALPDVFYEEAQGLYFRGITVNFI